jgi:hypothetical protein
MHASVVVDLYFNSRPPSTRFFHDDVPPAVARARHMGIDGAMGVVD